MPLLSPFRLLCLNFRYDLHFFLIEIHVCPKSLPEHLYQQNRVSTRKKNVTPTKVSTKKLSEKKDRFYTNQNVLMEKIGGVKNKANSRTKPCINQNGLTKKLE